MDKEFFISRFAANAEAIERLVKDIDEDLARWKPAPDKWCALEIVCHMYDEERFDFRTRIDYTLNKPGEAWPPIDPPGWVTEHNYMGRQIAEMVLVFLAERYKSIEWLRDLDDPDLTASYDHPQLGRITVGSLLGSWLAHDYLHLRQLSALFYHRVADEVAPHSLDYAGGL